MAVRAKTRWETKMFDVAREKQLSLREIVRRGDNLYSVGHLSLIKNGKRNVPNSLDFQNWIAKILDVPREEIFFARAIHNCEL